jgi:hypothetical protein
MTQPTARTVSRRALLSGVPYATAGLLAGLASAGAASVPAAPVRRTFDPREFGALGDGRTLDTVAIQRAIDACASAGGGTVVLHGGAFLSGTLVLKSHVDLRLERGTRLVGSPHISDYTAAEITLKNIAWALIFADGADDIAISGPGSLECNGKAFKGEAGPGGRLRDRTPRPVVVRFRNCTNVRLDQFKLRDYPVFGVHLIGCRDVVIEGLAIDCFVQPNNDGIDLWDCEKVFISNCSIFTGDDCIAIYSEHRACCDITIANCQLSTLCQAVRIGPHSIRNLERITVANCVFRDVGHSGICLQMCQGGVMQDLVFSNLVMENVVAPITARLGGWQTDPAMTWSVQGDANWEQGVLRNVLFQNIRARVPAFAMQGTPYERNWRNVPRLVGMQRSCLHLVGTTRTVIENVAFNGMHVTFPGGGTAAEGRRREVPELERAYPTSYMFGILPAYGLYARHVRGLSLHHVRFDLAAPDLRPAVVCDDVTDFALNGFSAAGSREAEGLMRLSNVRQGFITASRPLSTVAAFVQAENTADNELSLQSNDLRLVQA